MAKKAKQEVAVVEETPVAEINGGEIEVTEDMAQDLEKYEGAGTSTKAEDNLMPIVTLLQDLSPQVKDRNPEYVPGAKPGDFYIKGLGLLIPGGDGFDFQPCAFRTCVNEWVPRDDGGGFVASYEEMPPGAVQTVNDKGKKVMKSASGNDLIDTRYHSGFLNYQDMRIPAVLSFSSTGHTVSRGWMVMMNNFMIPIKGVNRKAPSWFKFYKVKSRLKQKNNQEWFICDIVPGNIVQKKEQRTEGKVLYEAFEVGDKTIDHATEAGAAKDDDAPF